MQTSSSPTVCRAFLGCQVEKVVDELNLSKKMDVLQISGLLASDVKELRNDSPTRDLQSRRNLRPREGSLVLPVSGHRFQGSHHRFPAVSVA
jgi:hypothetical protein